MKRKILVTGGQGFVGRALVDHFAELGHEVTCADIITRPFRSDVHFIKLDIRDADAVDAAPHHQEIEAVGISCHAKCPRLR